LNCVRVAEIVAEALKEVLGEDGFDVIPGPLGAFVDIAADEWTFRIEGQPVTAAWLSIEDEPDDPDRLAAARRAVMSTAVDDALADADALLGGALAAALAASRDPISFDLLTSMARSDRAQ
jgi:hypothetical protein